MEDFMSQEYQLHQFKSASELVGYMETHSETPRALVHFCHVVELAYLAGWDISTISKKDMEEAARKNEFMSLHHYDSSLVKTASARVAKGLVPENWRAELETIIANNGNPSIAHFAHTVHQK